MTDYALRYQDEDSCHHEVIVSAKDVPTAINNAFELHKDCKRVVRCYPKEMFDDQ